MLSLKANPKLPGDWKERHNTAVGELPHQLVFGRPLEQPIVCLLMSWAKYADNHKARYDSPIGADGVLGEYWLDIGKAIRGLLNGDCGRLDCGTLDGFILDTIAANGWDLGELGL